MKISYSPMFVRRFNALQEPLQEEAIEKIEQLKNPTNHKSLKVHKLTGSLEGRYGFSVNYKIRILFRYLATKPKEAYLLTIGDHDVYDG